MQAGRPLDAIDRFAFLLCDELFRLVRDNNACLIKTPGSNSIVFASFQLDTIMEATILPDIASRWLRRLRTKNQIIDEIVQKEFVIRERSIHSISQEHGVYTKIDAPHAVELLPYRIFGARDFDLNLKRPLPPRFVALIKNGLVHGSSTSVMTRGKEGGIHWMTHRELSLAKNPICYAEHFQRRGDTWLLSQNATLNHTIRLDRAVLIGGRFSFNYFHFIAETLVRLLIAEQHMPCDHSPLLVPKLHPKMLEMLTILVPKRAIFLLGPDDLARVDELVIPGAADFSPDDPEEVNGAVFDAPMLPALRKRMATTAVVHSARPKKIVFIRRRIYAYNDGTQSRGLVNQDEVEAFLSQYGAELVEPDILSIADQRILFSQATAIIGLAGAAMGNMIYCNAGTTVVVLIQNSSSVSSEYFGFMAQELGLRYGVVTCEAVPGTSHHQSHLSVRADLADLAAAIAWVNEE